MRLARAAREEDVTAFARRIGIRVEHVAAIEDGRFSELPAGIYGRSAVKAYAAACGIDVQETLADAERFLVSVDDPIVGLARLKGLRVPRPPVPDPPHVGDAPGRTMEIEPGSVTWRPLVAALIDALIVNALLLLVVLASVAALLVPVSALHRASPAFAVMGVLLALVYYLCFGGVGGATLGERLMHVTAPRAGRGMLTLREVAERALQSASEDVRCLCGLGARVGRSLAVSPAPAYNDDARPS